MKVAVVGAGVLGMSVAHSLVEAGAEVTLVERSGPGSGTSSRGAGLLCEGLWHPTSIALARRSLRILDAFSEDAAPFKLHRVGSSTLLTAAQKDAAAPFVRLQRAGGVDVQEMSPEEAQKLPRHERLDFAGVDAVLHYPNDGWAMPRLYCEILGFVHKMEEDMTFVTGPANLEALLAEHDAVVVAAGIWTRALLRTIGLDAPLLPYRTQAARYHHATAHDAPILHDAVQGFYLRPGTPGQMVAGNGTTTTPENPDAWREEADDAFADATARRIARRIPALADGLVTASWAGLDAATPDRLLLAGPHPDALRVWLLAGGNGHGFMRAPAAGESLAAWILGKTPRIDLSAFDPARFRGHLSDPFVIREGYNL